MNAYKPLRSRTRPALGGKEITSFSHAHPLATASIVDFESSGLISRAAKSYRVIAFDRPGYGHSSRPRDVVWTPARQADLIWSAP